MVPTDGVVPSTIRSLPPQISYSKFESSSGEEFGRRSEDRKVTPLRFFSVLREYISLAYLTSQKLAPTNGGAEIADKVGSLKPSSNSGPVPRPGPEIRVRSPFFVFTSKIAG